jgi:transcriptional regulator with XRE-family HTH domain
LPIGKFEQRFPVLYNCHEAIGGGSIFGEQLRRRRTAAGLALGTVARRAGISASYLSRLERGERGVPTVSVLAGLAEALDMPLAQMLQLAGVELSLPTHAEEQTMLYGLPPRLRDHLGQAVLTFTSDDWADVEALLAAKLKRRPS